MSRQQAGCRQGDKVARELNARIAALKEDNYEEYLKLAANTKNQRLRTLLEKTGSIIEELGLKVDAALLCCGSSLNVLTVRS